MTATRQGRLGAATPDPGSYDERAIREAVESGMARCELMAILDGRRVTDLIPADAGETPSDYALRATGELMVRYLAQDADEIDPTAGRI